MQWQNAPEEPHFVRTTTTDSPLTSQLAFRLPAQSVERRTETGSPWSATFIGRTTSLNLSLVWARTSWDLGEFRRPWQAVQAQADLQGAVQQVVVGELQQLEIQIEGEGIEGEKRIWVSCKLLKGIWFSWKNKSNRFSRKSLRSIWFSQAHLIHIRWNNPGRPLFWHLGGFEECGRGEGGEGGEDEQLQEKENSTTREVVVDEDSDEEYSPPKVRTSNLSKNGNINKFSLP